MEEYTFARENVRCPAKSEAKVEASNLGISIIGFAVTMMGIWALACVIGGLISSGGPFAMVKSWFGAVLGL